MSAWFTCSLCGRSIPQHESYLVRIEVLADPAMPSVDEETDPNPADEMPKLLEQIEKYTEEELQDQVYRSFEFRLCGKCQPQYLANPLGKPRESLPGHN